MRTGGVAEVVSAPSANPLAVLDETIDQLAAEDARFLPDAAQRQDLLHLHRAIQRLEAVFVDRLRVFDQTNAYASPCDPGLTAASWLRNNCNMSPQAAAQRVRVARQMAELTDTADAFAAGDISFEHAAVIAATAEDVGPEIARDAQQHLLPVAREVDPQRLRRVTSHLRHCLDPDGYLDDANRSHVRRYLHLSETMDGAFYINGRLDPEGGTMVRTALEPYMKPTPDDDRSTTHRRADALVELARVQLDRGALPETGGHKPHLIVIAQKQTLDGEPHSGPAELDGGQPVPGELARRIACDCKRTWVTVGPDSELLQIESPTNVIPPALRRALFLRDRTCRIPGCDRPAWMCDAHHMTPWSEGGPTVLSNLILCCRRHHRMIHEEGWRLIWGDGGQVVAIPPWAQAA